MQPNEFNLAVVSAGVLVNIPILAFIFGVLWKMNEGLTEVRTQVRLLTSQHGDGK